MVSYPYFIESVEHTLSLYFTIKMWFSAAVLGPLLIDPICYSRFFGRRGSVLIAASFSFAGSVWGSRSKSWLEYFLSRMVLGIG
jgi:hypothetical protein